MAYRKNLFRNILVLAIAIMGLFLTWQYISARWLTKNFHTVVEGKVYRSAQPSNAQLTNWVRDYGVRTIFNLRDDIDPALIVKDTAITWRAGAKLLHLPLSDRNLPPRSDFLDLISTLETAPDPMLIHCRAGADRTGVVSVLAAMAIGGVTYDEARSHLSLRYLHLGDDAFAVEGVLTKYEAYCQRHGIGTGGWADYCRWVNEHYSHAYYLVDFEVPERIQAQPGQLIEVEVTVHNLTDVPIPANDPDIVINLAAYIGTAMSEMPEKEFFPRARLSQPVPPEGYVSIMKKIWAPVETGIFEIHFDLVEEHVTWFVVQGSPERPHELVVVTDGGSTTAASDVSTVPHGGF